MKSNFTSVSYFLQKCFPISSKLTSFNEMDYLSRTFNLCFLTFETIQVFKIQFLSGTRLFHLARFNPNSQRKNAQSFSVKPTVMEEKVIAISSEASPNKKLKVEVIEEKKVFENKRKRPNYFVAVQISNPEIHEAIQRIQDHIIAQNMQFDACMNSIATLHITLMVMSITDTETHERALKALQNVYEEYNDEMCKNPLRLEFRGLGHFKNRVLYAKIQENKSFERLCDLAESVQKHFKDFEISSTCQREFNPHLTIAKIDFSKKKHKVLKKIDPSLYKAFANEHVGSETIAGIQLLSMTGPKDEAGYYKGKNLIFESKISSRSLKENVVNINEKKEDIRRKIATLAQKVLK